MQRVTFGQVAQVHSDELWQIFWHARDFQFSGDVVDQALVNFHSWRVFFARVVQRHFFLHLGVGIDALEVDVQDELLEGVVLHVAQQHFGCFASVFHLQDRSVESFFLQGVPQSVVVEFDQRGFSGATIDDARCTTSDTQTAARTRSLLSALKSDKFHN